MSAGGELAAIARIAALTGTAPAGQTWVGDDTAVIDAAGAEAGLLFASDLVVESVHFDRAIGSVADAGWKVLVANLSDVAAMGGRPLAAVVGVAGADAADLEALYAGMLEASAAYACPVVGGDLSTGVSLVVSVAILGVTDGRPPVLRAGARSGDAIFVTGPLGASAAGLRRLRSTPGATGPLVAAHLRPVPRLAEGVAVSRSGGRAMIDVSDGLGVDLHRLADASAVGFELDSVPVAPGATLEEALGGGEDYELVFTTAEPAALVAAFAEAGLAVPVRIGTILGDPARRTIGGEPLRPLGYEHALGRREP